ncbi:MAG TPA: threonine--tRNA ligase [Armatimonadota bacterium]|jgi:threonyl-tRNA synthetase
MESPNASNAPALAEQKPATSPEQLLRVRHSAAHVMAQAVTELFPGTKLAIGPATEEGFYYDFDSPHTFTQDDFEAIEKRMREIVKENVPFTCRPVSREEALAQFEKEGETYKTELIESFDPEAPITYFEHSTFSDLCRGPHVPRTGNIKAFKLLSVAGAYWRGDEHNKMLQRIYGTAYPNKAELEQHLYRIEEAKKRDHRKLGKELGLFTFSEDVGPGIPLFYPKGAQLRQTMEDYVRGVQSRYGYEHVWTGNIVKEDLYKKSGHYDNYRDVMFPPMVDPDGGPTYRLKPMNCPSHMTLFNTKLHSYRDLPARYAEFATLYRYEKTGELTGLTRVRALTQDDCHIFCTEEQVESEFGLALNLIREVLGRYGFSDYKVRLSMRGEEPGGKYVADDDKWNRATDALRRALEANGVEYYDAPGEAAFYGPKADFQTKDVLGREWTASTIQVDFIQPARLGCKYIGEDGKEHTPVVLHRAVTGTTERFMGLLIEQYAGAFPLWLSPVQAVIIPIADRHNEYAHSVQAKMKAAGFRVDVDTRNEKTGYKIREAQLQKTPYMLVCGDREVEADAVSVRSRETGDEGSVPVDELIQRMITEAA